jgi:hypothetical protein
MSASPDEGILASVRWLRVGRHGSPSGVLGWPPEFVCVEKRTGSALLGNDGGSRTVQNREVWVAATLVELSETLVSDFDDNEYADVLTARLAELLAPAEVGVAIVGQDAGQWLVTASSEQVRALVLTDVVQGDGPCASCYRSGQQLLNLDLAALAERWPRFADEAGPAGFGLASALPMSRHDETIGAIAVLDTPERPLFDSERDLTRMLVAAATIGLRQQRALSRSNRTAEQLQHALDSRVLIEQAKGVVAALLTISPDEAFEVLRSYSRRHNRRIVDVANDAIHRKLSVPDPTPEQRRGNRSRSSALRP